MKHSESIAAIAKAMAKFQKSPMILGKNAEGYGYHYVSLDKVVDRLLPELSSHGLSVMQPLDEVNGEPAIITLVMHTSGEWISTSYPLAKAGMKQVNDAQQMGAAIKYACRYGLKAAFCVPDSDDDDAACLTERLPAPRPKGKKYKASDPTPAEQIINGLRSCADADSLKAFWITNKKEIEASPKKDAIVSEFSVQKGELEERERREAAK